MALLLTGAAAAPLAARADAPAGEETVVQDVVVTARHREENVQNVPAAVTAIGGELLSATNTTGIAQIANLVPSLQFFSVNPRNSQMNIRGLGNNVGLANDGLDPGVGFYVDGVYYNRPATATFDLVDIERIESLSGPQGTLYGKNTTAGAVTVSTAAPSFTRHLTAEGSVGNFGYAQGKLSLTGPIIGDVLAGRLSIAGTRREGFQVNRFNGRRINDFNNVSLRGQLLYTPSEAIQVRLIGDFNRQDLHCCAARISGLWTPPSGVNFLTTAALFGYTPVVGGVDVDSPVRAEQESGGVSAQVDWSLSSMAVTSITAWRYWNWSPANDSLQTRLDDLTLSQTTDRQRQISQELRIASTGTNTVDYVGGLYFFHESVDADTRTLYGPAAIAVFISPALPGLILNGVSLNWTSLYRTDSYAAFGQATWHISPDLSLTGGLRYTWDDKRGSYNAIAAGGAPLAGPLAAFAAIRAGFATTNAYNVSFSKGAVGGHVDLAWQISSDVMAYAGFSRGNRSGGLNLIQLPAGASAVVAPETIDAYEAGLRTRLFDRRLTLNATAFYEIDRGYQAQTVDPVSLKSYLANIPQVRSWGLEATAQARPNADLSLYASATWDHAEYHTFPLGPCPVEQPLPAPTSCNFSGQPLPGVPRWALSGGFDLQRPVTAGDVEGQAYLGVDASYRSSLNGAATNSIYSRLPPRTLVNLRFGFRSPDRRWDAYVWARNAANNRDFSSQAAFSAGYLIAFESDPRTWGATLRFAW